MTETSYVLSPCPISKGQALSDDYIKLIHWHLRGWFLCLYAAAGSADRSWSGHPQDWAPCAEYQQTEPVSVKERLAMYQAAVTKKETSSSSSAAVRRYFHMDVRRDGGEDMPAAGEAAGWEEFGLNCWINNMMLLIFMMKYLSSNSPQCINLLSLSTVRLLCWRGKWVPQGPGGMVGLFLISGMRLSLECEWESWRII